MPPVLPDEWKQYALGKNEEEIRKFIEHFQDEERLPADDIARKYVIPASQEEVLLEHNWVFVPEDTEMEEEVFDEIPQDAELSQANRDILEQFA